MAPGGFAGVVTLAVRLFGQNGYAETRRQPETDIEGHSIDIA